VIHFVLKINNDFDDLRAAFDSVMQLLESNHAPSEVIFAANLAIEENATNIIKYGDEDNLKHEIAIGLEMRTSCFRPKSQNSGLGVHLVAECSRLRIRPP